MQNTGERKTSIRMTVVVVVVVVVIVVVVVVVVAVVVVVQTIYQAPSAGSNFLITQTHKAFLVRLKTYMTLWGGGGGIE